MTTLVGLPRPQPSAPVAAEPMPPVVGEPRPAAEGGGGPGGPSGLLEQVVSSCKLLIDASFLLAEEGRAFVTQQLVPALEKHQVRISLPNRTFLRLRRLAASAGSQASEAASAVRLARALEQSGRLERPGEASEVTGELASDRDLLVRVVYQHRMRDALALFTLDEKTAHAILGSNQMLALERAMPLHVLGLSSSRALTVWEPREHREHLGPGMQHEMVFDLERLARESRLFIDTCSLMLPLAEEFVRRRLAPVLSGERRLFVPARVLSELTRNARGGPGEATPEQERKHRHARAGLVLVQELETRGLVDMRRDHDEIAGNQTFFDVLMLRLLAQHQQSQPITLITQDRKLADQVLLNAHNLGVAHTRVGYINERGRPGLPLGGLGNWAWRLSLPKASHARDAARRTVEPGGGAGVAGAHPVRSRRLQNEEPRIAPFAVATELRRKPAERLVVSRLPGEGDVVRTQRSGVVTLTRRLSEGGEGVIFETSLPGKVCKVYLEPMLTSERLEKLTLMVTRPSPAPTICWPEQLAYNEAGEFVGYLMPQARGATFRNSIFMKPRLEKEFPQWGRQKLVQLAITTLSAIKKLHAINVLLGDINPNNFMVLNEREVYLVDTDSFQVEGYRCPVGMPHFTPPELMDRPGGIGLRTPEHEVFAIATLLFMILMPGKPPYAGQGGGTVEECIRHSRFPWVIEEGGRSHKPMGPYRYIWSHLHKDLKDDFIEIFYDKHRRPPPQRASDSRFVPRENYLDQFIQHLGSYRSSIQRERHSNEIFPTEIYFAPGDDLIALPCAEPGCARQTRTKRKWHEESLARGRTVHRCDKHRELHQLRKTVGEVPRERPAQHVGTPLRPSPQPPPARPAVAPSPAPRAAAPAASRPAVSSPPRAAAAPAGALVPVHCAHCGGGDYVTAEVLRELAAQRLQFVHARCRLAYLLGALSKANVPATAPSSSPAAPPVQAPARSGVSAHGVASNRVASSGVASSGVASSGVASSGGVPVSPGRATPNAAPPAGRGWFAATFDAALTLLVCVLVMAAFALVATVALTQ